MPKLEIELIDRPDRAAARRRRSRDARRSARRSRNAVFDATGVRLRTVPFTPERVKADMVGRSTWSSANVSSKARLRFARGRVLIYGPHHADRPRTSRQNPRPLPRRARGRRGYPDLHDHLLALADADKLFVVDEAINKDTEMHPLVRWQYRGGIEEPDRKAFLFTQPDRFARAASSSIRCWSRASPAAATSIASASASRWRTSARLG